MHRLAVTTTHWQHSTYTVYVYMSVWLMKKTTVQGWASLISAKHSVIAVLYSNGAE